MERHERERILLSIGLTKEEIAEATRRCLKAKKKRTNTVNGLKMAIIKEKAEGMSKMARRTLLFKGSSKKLYKKWQKIEQDDSFMIHSQHKQPRRSSMAVTRSDSTWSDSTDDNTWMRDSDTVTMVHRCNSLPEISPQRQTSFS